LSPILARLRSLGFAASEVGDHDLWGNAEIAWVAVGQNGTIVESSIRHSCEWLESLGEVEVQTVWYEELVPPG